MTLKIDKVTKIYQTFPLFASFSSEDSVHTIGYANADTDSAANVDAARIHTKNNFFVHPIFGGHYNLW